MSYEDNYDDNYEHGNGGDYNDQSPNMGYNGSRGYPRGGGNDDNGDFQGRPKPQSLFAVRPTPPHMDGGYYGPPRGKRNLSIKNLTTFFQGCHHADRQEDQCPAHHMDIHLAQVVHLGRCSKVCDHHFTKCHINNLRTKRKN